MHCPQPVFQPVPGSLSFLESGGKWLPDKGWRFKQSVLWSSVSLSLHCVEIFKEGRKMCRFPNYLTAETAPAGMPLERTLVPQHRTGSAASAPISLLFLDEVRRLHLTPSRPFTPLPDTFIEV